MFIQISGKQMELGEALQEHIAHELEAGVTKYFDRAGEAQVTLVKDGWAICTDISVHLPSGVTMQAHGEGADAHVSFAQALEKLEKRVRRYKRRLRDHNHRAPEPMPMELAPERVIRVTEDDDEDVQAVSGEAPAIVAESDTKIKTMTVSMAVMQLELAENPALLFRNAAHGGLNMVFRRPDGNVGWVDPGKEP